MVRVGRPWSRPARLEAAASVAAAVVLIVVAAVSADEHVGAVVLLGAAAVSLLAVGVVAVSAAAVFAAVALLATMTAVADTPGAPLIAVGLFVVAEAALASHDDRFRFTIDPGIWRDRLLVLGALLSASVLVGAVLRLLARDADARAGGYTVVAAACVVALAALMVIAARLRPR